MANVGRPRVLDDAKRREICALVSAGCGVETAASYVGCSPSTIRRESFRNDDFARQLRDAELASELNPLRAIREASRSNWRAAAWLLERTNPQRFGRRDATAFTPQEWQADSDAMVEKLAQEFNDVPTRDLIYRRIIAIVKHSRRERGAAGRTSRNLRRANRPISREELGPTPEERNGLVARVPALTAPPAVDRALAETANNA